MEIELRDMGMSILPRQDALPDLLDESGTIRLMTAAEIDAYDRNALRQWCHENARYGLVTVELVVWLREFIGERLAIEVGAGHGDLGKHVGILPTDNKMQDRPNIRLYYAAMGQPTVTYPSWVEKGDALAMVRRHRPAVVVGSWVTHWIDPRLPPPPGGGNAWGVKEDLILNERVTYVMIGNLHTHAAKRILKLDHDVWAFPWLRSRAINPELDRVFVWHGK